MSLSSSPALISSRALWRSWFVAVTAGEFVGFLAPAVVGATLATAPDAVLVPSIVVAGVVEGAVLGFAQATVLRRVLPRLAVGRFVVATAVAAALAYLLGMLPALAGDRIAALRWPLLLLVGTALGTVLLLSIGTAQWLVLRRALPRSGSWVLTTAGAWAAGLVAFLALTTPLWQPGMPVAAAIAVGVLGGLVMAAVVAALTGVAVVRLTGGVRSGSHPAPPA